MHGIMKKGQRNRLKRIFTSCGKIHDDELHPQRPPPPPAPSSSSSSSSVLDVREEYANAFRTESYFDFWTRVLDLTNHDTATRRSIDSSISGPRERLPSYRLFSEQLLDPDQASVSRLLDDLIIHHNNDTKTLLTDYFFETANASLLCGLLLKDIDQIRTRYHKAFKSLDSLLPPKPPASAITLPSTLVEFSKSSANPFASSSTKFTIVQTNCSYLLTRLESGRTKFEAKLRLVKGFKRGSAVALTALTLSLTAVLVCHGVAIAAAAAVAFPSVASSRFSLIRRRTRKLCPPMTSKLLKGIAMLDAASKGSYILSRDLDTLSRLMARLQDEFQHLRSVTGFWLEIRAADRGQTGGEVVRQLKRNQSSFREQLDELEEHLYLCFMTINRARNLVVTTILRSN